MARSFTSTLRAAARWSATGRAIRRGRGPQRVANIAIGRTAGRVLSRLWR